MNVTIKRGQIWEAVVPFGGDTVGAKSRPAVVIGWSQFGPDDDQLILIVPVSTFGGDSSKARTGDVRPHDWAGSRLSSGSFIRTRRVMALSPHAFDFRSGPIGMARAEDMANILTELQRLVSGSSAIRVS